MECIILTEKEKWRYFLKVILDVKLFCANNNLALRGKVEQISHRKSESGKCTGISKVSVSYLPLVVKTNLLVC